MTPLRSNFTFSLRVNFPELCCAPLQTIFCCLCAVNSHLSDRPFFSYVGVRVGFRLCFARRRFMMASLVSYARRNYDFNSTFCFMRRRAFFSVSSCFFYSFFLLHALGSASASHADFAQLSRLGLAHAQLERVDLWW